VGSVTDGTAGSDAAVIDRLLRELVEEDEPQDSAEVAA
jgi:hypothetical protein